MNGIFINKFKIYCHSEREGIMSGNIEGNISPEKSHPDYEDGGRIEAQGKQGVDRITIPGVNLIEKIDKIEKEKIPMWVRLAGEVCFTTEGGRSCHIEGELTGKGDDISDFLKKLKPGLTYITHLGYAEAPLDTEDNHEYHDVTTELKETSE